MRLKNVTFFLLIFIGVLVGVTVSANATPGAHELVQGQKEITNAVSSGQEQEIALSPFFLLRRKDSKVWIERIIVTFLMAPPKDYLKNDLNNPAFRKILYDLLQSEEPETVIQSQAMAGLNRQLGKNVAANVRISRSVIIVR